MRRGTIVTGLLVAAGLVAPAGPADAGFDNTWTKGYAFDYAVTGLYERYVYGGSNWIDNNRWDSSRDEGVDCSAYFSKSWAIPEYSSPQVRSGHPYTTGSVYPGGASYTRMVNRDNPRVDNFGGSYGGTTDPIMTTWVYRRSAGGPGDHMGLFWYEDSRGVWRMLEAKGAKYGVVADYRALSTLIKWNYRRFERSQWGRDKCSHAHCGN